MTKGRLDFNGDEEMSKPHIYRVNGKWYCNLRHDDGSGVAGFYRAALGMAFDTPKDAFAAWRIGRNITFWL